MFAASAGYHLVRRTDLAEILRRLDHAAIYAKIAGTYTPFTVLLGGDRALPILAGMWSAAGAGMLLKLIAPRRFEIATLALYLAMGWAVVVIGWPIIEALAPHARVLLVTGGLLYTVGVGFHLWDSLPFQNAIWHGFVLVASFVLYAAVLTEILRALPA
jgi:hemolysin III